MNLSDSRTPYGQPIDRTSASEAVFRELRGAIEGGNFEIGAKLDSEAKLSAHYAVSRSVIREALRSCAALGLTRTETGRGTFVISHQPARSLALGAHSSADLFEARPHIEVPAAELAANRRTEAHLQRLRELVEAMDAETEPDAWVELDTAFHEAIAASSGNSVFRNIVGDIRQTLGRQSETVNMMTGRREQSNAEHRRILNAISEADAPGAARAMQAHLSSVQNVVATIIRSTP